MTSPGRRNDVSHEEAAVPGEVRRWRAFSLLVVAYFMTIVDGKAMGGKWVVSQQSSSDVYGGEHV